MDKLAPEPRIAHHVIADHEPTYPDPITMHPGERVRPGKRDPEYPGWIWCTAADGRTGWVPEAYLNLEGDDAIACRDYSAIELRVRVGEEVQVVEAESGWVLATTSAGLVGWVPRSKLG